MKIFNYLLVSIFILILVLLTGCSQQNTIKYQCYDGSFVDSPDNCEKTNSQNQDCSACPATIEYKEKKVYIDKEVVKHVCPDGSVKINSKDCLSKNEDYSLMIEPTIYVETYWYGNYGIIEFLQFYITNKGSQRIEFYSTDLEIFKGTELLLKIANWNEDDYFLDKGEGDAISGSINRPQGLKVYEQGKYTAILKFKNIKGDVFYQYSSYFLVPYEK